MHLFLAATMFGAAFYINKKFKASKKGLLALLVGLAASMLLYRSPASQTILGWANDQFITPLAGWFGGTMGDPLPPSVVWAVLCIGGALVTAIDLWKNHTYNPAAIAALIITPVAAHGAGSGALPSIIDAVHTMGASAVAGIIGGAVGS
ncbi:hypothetical protein [Streptomonospora salina]|uniref:Nitrate/nitrite transporter NarK n=1 Tax=Streptomonospora salina TaxID=104205 RepID=A0A841EDS5_9ACTN|nr:hypothetical protein [Streptomonospora salina]MBB6001322.1 nitrate/nitrite transporter NarK [Streptomonospora salina]